MIHLKAGAGDETRTRNLNLGKVLWCHSTTPACKLDNALVSASHAYHSMSYVRLQVCRHLESLRESLSKKQKRWRPRIKTKPLSKHGPGLMTPSLATQVGTRNALARTSEPRKLRSKSSPADGGIDHSIQVYIKTQYGLSGSLNDLSFRLKFRIALKAS